jgi:hypothetical protein
MTQDQANADCAREGQMIELKGDRRAVAHGREDANCLREPNEGGHLFIGVTDADLGAFGESAMLFRRTVRRTRDPRGANRFPQGRTLAVNCAKQLSCRAFRPLHMPARSIGLPRLLIPRHAGDHRSVDRTHLPSAE